MRYVAYYRVSTQRQGISGLGLAAQESAVQSYVSSQPGSEIVASFREVESGKHNDCPQLQEAINRCKLTGATLIIAKLDRLSRNASFLFQLRDSGLDFLCADMPGANRLTVSIMACMAEEERRLISERTRNALKAAKARGQKLGSPLGAKAFNGHDREGASAALKAKADSSAAQLAPMVSSMRANGMTLRQIAATLNAEGVKTARNSEWHASTVNAVLKRISA